MLNDCFLIVFFSLFNIAFAEDQIQLCDEVEHLCDDISCPHSDFQYDDIPHIEKLLLEAENLLSTSSRNRKWVFYSTKKSAIRYVQARRCLETLPENVQKKQDVILLMERVKEAERQAIYRLDNAHDTVRSVMWPIWWIIEADPTVEWYDDVFMKATELLWEKNCFSCGKISDSFDYACCHTYVQKP